KNKIGLIKKDNFIKKFDDVVLAFPYKDCMLEGGQTKDDDKNNEIFYNNIISSDEIDRLFDKKVLTNFKRFDKDGEHKVDEIKDDDNLIIKGNNLIALHSLKERYQGKVKLIYIDPPYNTGNDTFNYNDNFNHSTWLTFMKNRLEVAREFLSDDGVIFVQCDDNEQAYLKVLMDEIFGITNTDYIVWNKEAEEKSGTLKQVKRFRTIHEIINIGYKNKQSTLFSKISEPLIGRENELHTANLAVNAGKEKIGHPNWMEIISPNGTKWNKHWKFDNETIMQYLEDNLIYYGKDGNNQPRLILPMDDRRKVYLSSIINKGSTTMGRNELESMFKKDIFSYPKPEILIKLIIGISTNPNDLVMDFHLGSGTTCAVAHKMGRRYIGIEQMDYIEDISVERMKKVINGEQGGISKELEWNGGGSFVYAELKKIDDFKSSEIGSLNKNMQYLPLDEIDDETYNISDKEKSINKKFYGVTDE
ncbi:MAG: site-specific DNA-methyltransferase, partial [Campylobacterota bacterium]|nr:site-specific DNA-methyltransferase [Campylobacterota bacterium]